MDENLNNEIDEKKDLETETIIESKEEDDSLKNEIIKNNLESQYNFNCLVLSGGGSKGYSMLGALQYLYDKGYMESIKNFIGTSIGGIISYLLIIGMTPIEIIVYLSTHKITERLKHFNLVAMIHRQGALNFSILSEAIEKITLEKVGYHLTMKDISKKYGKRLILTTYNLTEDKLEYLSDETHPDLPCLIALRMTANLPFIFEDFKYYNNYYIDGGVIDNFPIDYFDNNENIVFGLNLKTMEKFKSEDNTAEYFLKLISIPLNKWVENKVKNVSSRCKILNIECDNLSITKFDVNNHQKLELFSKGYEDNKKYFES